VLHNFVAGDSPAQAASDAVRPGSACDTAQRGNAPVVDAAYLSDPLTTTPAGETPGQVGRDLMLTVAERVRALAATLAPGSQ
jgi:hypothetical protein